MMKEAQKLQQDPNFQRHMEQMMKQSQFQTAIAQTKENMKDPKKALEMEEEAKKAIEEGNKELEEYEKKRRQHITEQVAIAKAKQREEEEKRKAEEAAAETSDDNQTSPVTGKDEINAENLAKELQYEIPALTLN